MEIMKDHEEVYAIVVSNDNKYRRKYYKGTLANCLREIIQIGEYEEVYHKSTKEMLKYLKKHNGQNRDHILEIHIQGVSGDWEEALFSVIEEEQYVKCVDNTNNTDSIV